MPIWEPLAYNNKTKIKARKSKITAKIFFKTQRIKVRTNVRNKDDVAALLMQVLGCHWPR